MSRLPGGGTRRGRALFVALPVTAAIWLGALQPVAATAPLDVAWGLPTATALYGHEITFSQPIETAGLRARVELLISYPAAPGPVAVEVSPADTAVAGRELTYQLRETVGQLAPNTTLHARWRIDAADGQVALGPDVSVTYADTRFSWSTTTGSIASGAAIRVHWYQGSAAFGARALAVGQKAVADADAFFGVRETDPIDFFIYATKAPFDAALGFEASWGVIGQEHPDIRTMFALVPPDATPGTVVIHELTHLVFNTAVTNPYHFPPTWLNEGLAVYLSEGYNASRRALVEEAVASGTIIPLLGLAAGFPTNLDRGLLAYGEGASAVDYLVRTHGKAALVKLVRSYSTGLSDDEAFRAALGTGTGSNGPDVAGFQAAWLADLGAAAPIAYGPAPAPAGPLPPGWSGAPAAVATNGVPGSPSASVPPGSTPPVGGGNGATTSADSTVVGVAVVVLIALAGLGVLLARRSRRRPSGGDA
jgi:hypothetical protein